MTRVPASINILHGYFNYHTYLMTQLSQITDAQLQTVNLLMETSCKCTNDHSDIMNMHAEFTLDTADIILGIFLTQRGTQQT